MYGNSYIYIYFAACCTSVHKKSQQNKLKSML